MNFLRPHKTLHRRLGGVFATLFFFAVLGLVQYLAPNLLGNVATRAALPLLSARVAFRTAWNEGDAEQSEITRLRAENSFLYALVQADVDERPADALPQGLLAPVLARPRWSAYDTLLVGAGETQGIASGMRISAHGFVIGEITEVYADSSRAVLYSTAGRRITAQLAGTLPVELVGTGGGTFEASIAEGAPVRAGDGAFDPRLSPRLFAIVDAVADNGEGGLTVRLRLPVNPFELDAVEIVAPF